MQRLINNTFCFIFSSWLIIESGYGMMQVWGMARSGHILYSLTGHFQNPGPFGGFVAMLMSICLAFLLQAEVNNAWQRWTKWICAIAAAMGFIVLPASMSRAGWLGLAVSLGVLALRNQKIRKWFSEKPFLMAGTLAALIPIGVGAFLLKRDSALGRVHVWHMELLAMLKAPITGAGTGRLYPLVLLQELYLSQGETKKASHVLETIRRIPVNPRNSNMQSLRERAEKNHLKQ